MTALIKVIIQFSLLAVGFIAVFVSLQYIIRHVGLKLLQRKKHSMACGFFCFAAFILLDEKSRLFRSYCRYRKGKLQYEQVRYTIENSRISHTQVAHKLLQRVGRIEMTR